MTAAGIQSCMQIFSRFGLTWHRKVNFSTFSGKLTILHRFFFFVPETLHPIFLGKSKKTRAGKCSRSVKLKVDLVNYDAIWCQIGSQFLSPFLGVLSPKTCGHFIIHGEPGKHFIFSVFMFHGFPMDFPWISH